MRLLAGIVFSITAVSSAFAADPMQEAVPSDTRFFGDAYLGGHVLFGSEQGEDFMVPMVDLGGRVAGQFGAFGAQVDAEYSGFKLDWVRPEIELGGADGSVTAVGFTGHATYNFSERLKAGAYLGYMRGGVSITDGIDFVDVELDSLVYGVEAIYQFNENNWIEANVGLVDPRNFTVTSTMGFPMPSMPLDDIDGFNVGAGYTHRFDPQWTATGKVNFTRLTAFDESVDFLSLKATAAYRFETMPLALSTSLGYTNISTGGDSVDAFNIGTRLTWSFGDSGNDAGGKLFSTRRALDGLF